MSFRNVPAIAIAIAATSFFLVPDSLVGATKPATAPMITYAASGTFASVPVNGVDELKLAGEPFNVSIVVSSATKPTKTGKNWALYSKLKLTGSVYSALLGSVPVAIASGQASIEQFVNAGQNGLFVMTAPVRVVGINLTITATVTLPPNTLIKPTLHTFGPVALTTTDTLMYAEGTTSTTLAIDTGTLSATIPAAATTEPPLASRNVVLAHPAGVQEAYLPGDECDRCSLPRRVGSMWDIC